MTESERIVGKAIDAMKGNPLALGLLLVNMLFISAITYAVTRNNAAHAEQIIALIQACARR